MNAEIRIFITGGTFDKEYDELTGRPYFKDSHVPEMLKLGLCNLNLEIRTLMTIDSLEMTDLRQGYDHNKYEKPVSDKQNEIETTMTKEKCGGCPKQ